MKPAFPSTSSKLRCDKVWDDRLKEWRPYSVPEKHEDLGISNVEYFAAAALNGMLASGYGTLKGEELEDYVENALLVAKIMVKRLERDE